jgi:sugar phosphate isomerase/epimerase
MKIGMVSDSLADLSLTALLDTARQMGIEGVELNTGGWSAAPHVDLPRLLESAAARNELLGAFASRGLALVSLNANGNQLHPVSGDTQSQCLHDTVRLAGLLGVKTVCCMSGLPQGLPDDKSPNWIISSWPPETQEMLAWQWREKLLPYWRELTRVAADNGVERFAVELHGNQLVYNVPALLRLRGEIGPMVGANLDPSHLMWMGADPLAAIDALGTAIHHVHAKDTYLNRPVQATTSLLENGGLGNVAARSWSYVTLGYGHGEIWWREFCYRLRLAGYDGWLSIEHEDVNLSRLEGVRRSVAVLRSAAPVEPSDYAPPSV